jgi:hypothetical protein
MNAELCMQNGENEEQIANGEDRKRATRQAKRQRRRLDSLFDPPTMNSNGAEIHNLVAWHVLASYNLGSALSIMIFL